MVDTPCADDAGRRDSNVEAVRWATMTIITGPSDPDATPNFVSRGAKQI
jgi:hypothetical protein